METSVPQELIVPIGTTPTRLDVFVVQHSDLSRTQVQKAIKGGMIMLNGQKVKPHHLTKTGDQIMITDDSVNVSAERKKVPDAVPTIIFEDDNYLVVNKPSGLVVHGGPGIHEPTLADWAVAHDEAVAHVGDQPDQRPGIVHRLDRDVSGVMVIAKTQPAFADLKRQFQNHSINKEYIALAHGMIVDSSGRISFAIARKPDKSGLMTARPKSEEGLKAETLFTVERRIKNTSLVRVKTLTGRTHQIRVHFKAIGHALVGDPLYKARKLRKEKIEAPRLFLHAAVLGFTDLDGQPRQFEAPLPNDLQQFLSRVG